MLYRHSELVRSALLASDLLLIGAAWIGAYFIRFHGPIPMLEGIEVPPFEAYAVLLVVILPLWLWLFRRRGLYEPQRTGSVLRELAGVWSATLMGVLLLVAANFFVRDYLYSRAVIVVFAALSGTAVSALRASARVGLQALRRRGYNLRFVVVVGAGELAEEVIERLHGHPEVGLRVLSVVAGADARVEPSLAGVPVVRGYENLKALLARRRVDQIVVALPREETHELERILADLEDELVSVRLVPDLRHVLTLQSTVEDLEGLPMVRIRETPFMGLDALRKRSFDLVVASLGLLLVSPLLVTIAGLVWLTSGGPVLYRQERMGLDGRQFSMLKFRTMRTDAEEGSGPVWAQGEDPRRTPIGAWLRRLSLDELPQLWNVVRGDMSLVGPRPERPVFIERFRREVPGYMLRHQVRAGLTGWAQVNGWRGDTSLHERIEHDIYYIQNWSLALDIRILLMTLWRMWSQPSAS